MELPRLRWSWSESIYFARSYGDILPGAGTGDAQNFPCSGTLLSRSPRGRDEIEVFDDRPSMSRFDMAQEQIKSHKIESRGP